MMQALELLQLVEGTSWDKATGISEEIRPVALELHLSEGISQIVSQKVHGFVFAYAHPVEKHYITDREEYEEHKKYFLPLGNMNNSLMTALVPTMDELQ